MVRRFACALLSAGLLSLPASASPQAPVVTVFDDEQQIVSDVPMTMPLFMWGRELTLVVVEIELDDEGAVKTAQALSGPRLVADDAVLNVKRWRFAPNPKHRAVVIYRFEILKAQCRSGIGYGTATYSRRGHVATITGCSPLSQP